MTAQEAIRLAAAIEDPENIGFLMKGELIALRAVCHHAPATVKRATLKYLLEQAERFRQSDAPGHQTWYHTLVKAAAYAALNLGV